MLFLIALPLGSIAYLSLFKSYTKTKIVEVKSTSPLLGGLVQETVQKIAQPVLDESGNPIHVSEYVGLQNIKRSFRFRSFTRIFSR